MFDSYDNEMSHGYEMPSNLSHFKLVLERLSKTLDDSHALWIIGNLGGLVPCAEADCEEDLVDAEFLVYGLCRHYRLYRAHVNANEIDNLVKNAGLPVPDPKDPDLCAGCVDRLAEMEEECDYIW